MTYKEILELEDVNTDKIYLYKTGLFLHAYDRSAYFVHKRIHPFKLSYRYIKSVNRNVASLGFPYNVKDKWLCAYPVQEDPQKELVICEIGGSFDEVDFQQWLELARVAASIGDQYTHQTATLEKMPVAKAALEQFMQSLDLAKHLEKVLWDPLGHQLKNLSYQIVWGVWTLFGVSDRNEHIDTLQMQCRELAFVLQVLCDRKAISRDAFATASERIVSIGKQLGALRRKATAEKVCGDNRIQQPTVHPDEGAVTT